VDSRAPRRGAGVNGGSPAGRNNTELRFRPLCRGGFPPRVFARSSRLPIQQPKSLGACGRGRAFSFNLWRPTAEWRPHWQNDLARDQDRLATIFKPQLAFFGWRLIQVPGPKRVNGSQSSIMKARQCARAIQGKAYRAVNPAANRL